MKWLLVIRDHTNSAVLAEVKGFKNSFANIPHVNEKIFYTTKTSNGSEVKIQGTVTSIVHDITESIVTVKVLQ
jgi:hypothetical protein